MDSLPIRHPFAADLSFLYGVIFIGPAHDPAHHSRNICIFAAGEVDRCPTGAAHITGLNRLLIDPHDPLKYGFILR